MAALSAAFRGFCASLGGVELETLEIQLQNAFGIRNIRNVQLWTRQGTQQRNIINSRLGAMELEMRVALVRGLLNESPISVPTKVASIEGRSSLLTQRLGRYLQDNYTRDNLIKIVVSPSGLLYIYDAYGTGDDEIPDESSDEFEDIFE